MAFMPVHERAALLSIRFHGLIYAEFCNLQVHLPRHVSRPAGPKKKNHGIYRIYAHERTRKHGLRFNSASLASLSERS